MGRQAPPGQPPGERDYWYGLTYDPDYPYVADLGRPGGSSVVHRPRPEEPPEPTMTVVIVARREEPPSTT